jgi:iron complex outermembrane receptor protein
VSFDGVCCAVRSLHSASGPIPKFRRRQEPTGQERRRMGGERDMTTRHVNTLVLSALLCGCASAAFAQAAPQGGNQPTSLTEVVVTAQRRAERLEQVPISVTALTPQALAGSGINNIHDLGHAVAGVQIDFAGGYTQPAIRGVTTLTVGIGYENNVAIYVDGFYEPDTTSINQDFANVSNVQVLKGPQGTLYGRNATGGAILIDTADPAKVFTGSLKAGYGNYKDANLQAYVSGPLTDMIGISLAGYTRYTDSYIKAINALGQDTGPATPVRQDNFRAKVLITPTSDLRITLGYNYSFTDDPRGLTFHTFEYSSMGFIPGDTPYGPPYNTMPTGPYTATTNVRPSGAEETNEATIKVEDRTPWGDLKSLTSYALRKGQTTFDYDGTLQNIYIGEFAKGTYANLPNVNFNGSYADERTFQETLLYDITAIPRTDLLLGAEYYNDWLNQPNELGLLGGYIGTLSNSLLKAQAEAIYFDAKYKITDALTLTIGGRGSFEQKSAKYSQYYFIPAASPILPFSNNANFSAFTPRATIMYALAPRTNVYASYTQGFRSGAFNVSPEAPGNVVPAKPERIGSYEVGFKTASSWYTFDTAAFFYNYRDLQVGLTEPSPACLAKGGTPQSCPVVNIISNAPEAQAYGIDVDGSISPVENLVLKAGVEWLHARYTKFSNADGTGLYSALGIDVTGQTQNWTGDQMARAPTVTANAAINYKVPLTYGKLDLTLAGSYSTQYALSDPSVYGPLAPAALQHKERFVQPDYGLLNASVGWTSPNEHYTITAHVNNLTNTKYRITFNGGAFGDYETPGEPVNYGVELGYKF